MDAELSKLNKLLMAAGRARSCRDDFDRLKSDDERFSFALNLLREFKFAPSVETAKKSSAQSAKHRKDGNDLFTSAKSDARRDATLESYTKCVAFAEPNSADLAYAYGNRSALLFRARLYDHCLRDIERALRIADCPENLKVKLLSRRLRCLETRLAGRREAKSQETVDQTMADLRRCIDGMNIDESLKTKYRDNLVNAKVTAAAPQRKLFDEERHKPPAPGDNPELPGVSSALKVSYDATFGRHVTATRDIRPGEVLAVQKGYATILAPEHFHTHCSNCLRQTWSAVPCDRCPLAVYCDEKCRDEAWRHHHDVECGVVGAMLSMEFNLLGLMSLRLAVRAVRDAGGFEALRRKLEAVESWPDLRTKGFTGSPPILDESDYPSVYTLAKNTEKRSGPDLFGRAFNSVYIVYFVATMSKFLGETTPRDLEALNENPWTIFLGGLLTRHQQIIPSNVHAVMEMKGLDERERGASLIPFLSLLNHKCDNMVTRVHYGNHVVLYAVLPIEAGDQVYDNYGMHYALERRLSRQEKLRRQFYFDCRCLPCDEDWPLLYEIPSLASGHCDYDRSLNVQAILKKFNKYVEIATNSEIEDKLYVINDVVKIVETFYEKVELPCREVNEAVETLKRMYNLLSARYQSLCDKTDGRN